MASKVRRKMIFNPECYLVKLLSVKIKEEHVWPDNNDNDISCAPFLWQLLSDVNQQNEVANKKKKKEMRSRKQIEGCKSQDDNGAAKRATSSGWSRKMEESRREVKNGINSLICKHSENSIFGPLIWHIMWKKLRIGLEN